MNWTFSLNELDAVAKEFWQLQKDKKFLPFMVQWAPVKQPLFRHYVM
jgi:hypothetical protein